MSIDKTVSSPNDIPDHVLNIIANGDQELVIEVIDPIDDQTWMKSTLPFGSLKRSCPRLEDFTEAVCCQIDTFVRLAHAQEHYLKVNGKLYKIPTKDM